MNNAVVNHIEKTPGVWGGRARIGGHRVRVQDIVTSHEKRGYSPDEIVDMFPGIPLADVYAALAYYFDNRQEIEDEFKSADEWAEWVKAKRSLGDSHASSHPMPRSSARREPGGKLECRFSAVLTAGPARAGKTPAVRFW